LKPAISAISLEHHYTVITNNHVKKINELGAGTEFLFEELSSTIKTTFQDPKNAAIYHHASELWNHMFFFKGMTPGGKKMSSDVEQLIVQNFGGMEQLKEQFVKFAKASFALGTGNGWIWLLDVKGQLQVTITKGSESPVLIPNATPLLGLDLWEHSYFLDYKSNVEEYVMNWFEVVNWHVVAQNMAKAADIAEEKS